MPNVASPWPSPRHLPSGEPSPSFHAAVLPARGPGRRACTVASQRARSPGAPPAGATLATRLPLRALCRCSGLGARLPGSGSSSRLRRWTSERVSRPGPGLQGDIARPPGRCPHPLARGYSTPGRERCLFLPCGSGSASGQPGPAARLVHSERSLIVLRKGRGPSVLRCLRWRLLRSRRVRLLPAASCVRSSVVGLQSVAVP